MTGKFHNHIQQTNPWHHEEETQKTNCHTISKGNQAVKYIATIGQATSIGI